MEYFIWSCIYLIGIFVCYYFGERKISKRSKNAAYYFVLTIVLILGVGLGFLTYRFPDPYPHPLVIAWAIILTAYGVTFEKRIYNKQT